MPIILIGTVDEQIDRSMQIAETVERKQSIQNDFWTKRSLYRPADRLALEKRQNEV